jgi:hypothetical protein
LLLVLKGLAAALPDPSGCAAIGQAKKNRQEKDLGERWRLDISKRYPNVSKKTIKIS